MKHFITNPYTFFLSLLGYEIKKPSMILGHMLDVTHGGWLERMRNNNNINNFEYELYSK